MPEKELHSWKAETLDSCHIKLWLCTFYFIPLLLLANREQSNLLLVLDVSVFGSVCASVRVCVCVCVFMFLSWVCVYVCLAPLACNMHCAHVVQSCRLCSGIVLVHDTLQWSRDPQDRLIILLMLFIILQTLHIKYKATQLTCIYQHTIYVYTNTRTDRYIQCYGL